MVDRLGRICTFIIAVGALAIVNPPVQAQQPEKPKAQQEEQQEDVINADRPGIADGSTVIGRAKSGKARFQLETGFQSEFRSNAGSTERRWFLPTLLRFGINDKWEARIEAPGGAFVSARTSNDGMIHRTDGYTPISLGVKNNFQPPEDAHPYKPSLGTILRVFFPSGSSDFGAHRVQADIRLAADINLNRSGSLELNPNIGVGAYDDGQNGFAAGLFAITLNYFNKDKTLNPFVDMGLQGPEVSHGRTTITVDTGLAYTIKPNLQLDASVGTGILGRTPAHPFWAVGVSERF